MAKRIEPRKNNEFGAVLAFSLVNSEIYKQARAQPFFQQAIGRIIKLANNNHMHVGTRVNKLGELAKEFDEQYRSSKEGSFLRQYHIDGVPLLARQAQAAAEMLMNIEKARTLTKSDVGHKGNQV